MKRSKKERVTTPRNNQCVTYARQTNMTAKQIGRAVGYSECLVKRTLRLAGVR